VDQVLQEQVSHTNRQTRLQAKSLQPPTERRRLQALHAGQGAQWVSTQINELKTEDLKK
jgi:hypothetical protein